MYRRYRIFAVFSLLAIFETFLQINYIYCYTNIYPSPIQSGELGKAICLYTFMNRELNSKTKLGEFVKPTLRNEKSIEGEFVRYIETLQAPSKYFIYSENTMFITYWWYLLNIIWIISSCMVFGFSMLRTQLERNTYYYILIPWIVITLLTMCSDIIIVSLEYLSFSSFTDLKTWMRKMGFDENVINSSEMKKYNDEIPINMSVMPIDILYAGTRWCTDLPFYIAFSVFILIDVMKHHKKAASRPNTFDNVDT